MTPNGHTDAEPHALCTVVQTPWSTEQEAELRELVRGGEQAAWAVGDAVLALVPVGATKAASGAFAHLRQLAERVGAEFTTLKRARQVAHAWPPPSRVERITMSAHGAYCTGGAAQAPERAAFLRKLSEERGHVTADSVREARGLKRCRSTVDPLRSVLGRIARMHHVARRLPDRRGREGHASPAVLKKRAAQLRDVAAQLERLAES